MVGGGPWFGLLKKWILALSKSRWPFKGSVDSHCRRCPFTAHAARLREENPDPHAWCGSPRPFTQFSIHATVSAQDRCPGLPSERILSSWGLEQTVRGMGGRCFLEMPLPEPPAANPLGGRPNQNPDRGALPNHWAEARRYQTPASKHMNERR